MYILYSIYISRFQNVPSRCIVCGNIDGMKSERKEIYIRNNLLKSSGITQES
jgi:hypothetical protein